LRLLAVFQSNNLLNFKNVIMKKTIIVIAVIAAYGIFLSSCEEKGPDMDKVTLEELPLDESGYYNGSDGKGGFSSGNIFFNNSYNPQYQSWSGFAYTNHTDNETHGYANQYSAIAGSGADDSEKYAVLSSWAQDTIFFDIPERVTNISICNSTYAYYSMLEGDDFAKKFGGETGDDKDFFNLIIEGFDVSDHKVLNLTVALADYTFDDNNQDYIGNAWTDIDLSEAGHLSYMVFYFESSDTGDYGINTPTYVCIDNIFGELLE